MSLERAQSDAAPWLAVKPLAWLDLLPLPARKSRNSRHNHFRQGNRNEFERSKQAHFDAAPHGFAVLSLHALGDF
jgi:hypothetical protein